MTTEMITAPQLKAIHAAKRARALEDEIYRDFLFSRCRVRSAKALTKLQAMAILREWRGPGKSVGSVGSDRSGHAAPRAGRNERLPHELPTIEQSRMIDGLLHTLGFVHVDDQERGMKLVFRICGHVWPQTRAEGNKVIEGLKAMQKRGWQTNAKGRNG